MKYYKFILLSLHLTLISCGQAGPLYLPSKTPPVETNTEIKSTPTIDNTAQQK